MDTEFQKKICRHPLSLLLAEDDDPLRESLASFFLSEGYNVFPASSGIEAVEIGLSRKVCFSVMDINLPGLSGIEAFKSIAGEKGILPCIFMSGDTSRDTMIKAMEAGGFSFLSKPIQIQLMKRSVEQLVDRYFFKK